MRFVFFIISVAKKEIRDVFAVTEKFSIEENQSDVTGVNLVLIRIVFIVVSFQRL